MRSNSARVDRLETGACPPVRSGTPRRSNPRPGRGSAPTGATRRAIRSGRSPFAGPAIATDPAGTRVRGLVRRGRPLKPSARVPGIGEPRLKPHGEDRVIRPRVPRDNLSLGPARCPRDRCQVRPAVPRRHADQPRWGEQAVRLALNRAEASKPGIPVLAPGQGRPPRRRSGRPGRHRPPPVTGPARRRATTPMLRSRWRTLPALRDRPAVGGRASGNSHEVRPDDCMDGSRSSDRFGRTMIEKGEPSCLPPPGSSCWP